jgi:hypothetical protein
MKNLLGMRFGRLIVTARAPRVYQKSASIRWACRCDCGNPHEAASSNLLTGNVTSCGCFARDVSSLVHRTHGMHGTSTYSIWVSMIKRCHNPKDTQYPNYGGRGITVCSAWRDSFESFYADMGTRPNGMELDRWPNNDGNYEPGNVRWATRSQNGGNKRNSRWVTIGGETRTLTDWARVSGVQESVIEDRIRRGVDHVLSPVSEKTGLPLKPWKPRIRTRIEPGYREPELVAEG